MTRRWIATALAAAGLTVWYVGLPAAPTTTPAPTDGALPVRGAVHIHTRRSDGSGTIDDVAAAAARAGLQFVIVTDHGDGSAGTDTPAYRRGVLCIDAVEISSSGGHIVALGLPQTPFPLGGESADVLEDVRRFGGMSIAAHPDSRRGELAWRNWNDSFDGIEWLNGDSEWRDESWPSLGRALLTYPFRPAATLGALLDRPDEMLSRWDRLLQQRTVVGLAASDAHARIGPGGDPYGRTVSLPLPSYEQVFRTFSISLPGTRLTGNAGQDSVGVLDAIRRGQVYSSIDALASPAVMVFTATSGDARETMGGEVAAEDAVLTVEANVPDGATVRLLSNGEPVAHGSDPVLRHTAATAGAYRVEIDLVRAPGTPPVPWVVSNPIYIGKKPSSDSTTSNTTPSTSSVAVFSDGPATSWRVEKNVRSEGRLSVAPTVGGTQLLLRYGLGGVLSESPYVAAVAPQISVKGFDRITFSARAARPMRVVVQLRASSGAGDRRWGKSVYLEEEVRTISVPFGTMLPIGAAATDALPLEDIRELLFVVDTVNTKPGTSGQVWIDDVKLER